MGKRLAGLAAIAWPLASCGGGEEPRNDLEAAAAGFQPPSVTSRVDWGGQVERRFHELDRNETGKLETVEWPRAESRLADYDRDEDDEVSEEEFTEGSMARFDAMDLNKDGVVTSEEVKTSGGQPLPVR
ncbi:MAG TPA: EF-hand domain-containing protein [Sphingomonas sp.]|jgi:hypothetical protein